MVAISIEKVQLPSTKCDLQVPIDELVDCNTVVLSDSRASCTSADIGHIDIFVAVEACAVGQFVCSDIAAVDHATKGRLRYEGSIDTIEGREANSRISMVICMMPAATAKT